MLNSLSERIFTLITMSIQTLFTYFPELTATQKEQFEALAPLYAEWNEKINVISRKDMEQFYVHHVLHSLAITKIATFNAGVKMIDIGTGGGFPGIPLAIYYPELHFTLADAIGKKIKVVSAISEELCLTNVKPIHTRVEQIKDRFDFTISRAVTQLDTLYQYSKRLIHTTPTIKATFNGIPLSRGMFCLKGGDLETEKEGLASPVMEFQIRDCYKEEFFETKKVLLVNL